MEFGALFPEQADWWRAHAKMPPTLILVCGIDDCHERVGEIKTYGDLALALMYSRFGEWTIPVFPEAGMTEKELQQRIAVRDAQTIRYTGDGRRVTKRRAFPASVMPLDLIHRIICPAHRVVELPDAAATIAEIRETLAATRHASKRRHLMFGGRSLS